MGTWVRALLGCGAQGRAGLAARSVPTELAFSGFQGGFLFLQKAPLLADFARQFTPQKLRFSGVKVKGKVVRLCLTLRNL